MLYDLVKWVKESGGANINISDEGDNAIRVKLTQFYLGKNYCAEKFIPNIDAVPPDYYIELVELLHQKVWEDISAANASGSKS